MRLASIIKYELRFGLRQQQYQKEEPKSHASLDRSSEFSWSLGPKIDSQMSSGASNCVNEWNGGIWWRSCHSSTESLIEIQTTTRGVVPLWSVSGLMPCYCNLGVWRSFSLYSLHIFSLLWIGLIAEDRQYERHALNYYALFRECISVHFHRWGFTIILVN